MWAGGLKSDAIVSSRVEFMCPETGLAVGRRQAESALQSSPTCTFEVENGFPKAPANAGADQPVPVETEGWRAASLSVAR